MFFTALLDRVMDDSILIDTEKPPATSPISLVPEFDEVKINWGIYGLFFFARIPVSITVYFLLVPDSCYMCMQLIIILINVKST